MINAEIGLSIEAKELDEERDLLTIRLGTGETMLIFLVLYRLKGNASHKLIQTANQEVLNVRFMLPAYRIIDLWLVLHLRTKTSTKQ